MRLTYQDTEGYRSLLEVGQSRIRPTSHTLEKAFEWPTVLKEALTGRICKGVAATSQVLTVASHWSGICTQSRGLEVLQANKLVSCTFRHVQYSDRLKQSAKSSFQYCCIYSMYIYMFQQFLHLFYFFCKVSFTEKTKQGQATLQRDFQQACVFQDCLHILPEHMRQDPSNASEPFGYETCAPCVQHKDQRTTCPIPINFDISIFGAPCVDDSTMGTLKKEEGKARPVCSQHFEL